LRHSLIQNELPKNKFNALKRSHHGLVETTQMINLLNHEGHLLSKDVSIHCAKSWSCRFPMFLALGAAFLAPPALHSKRRQVFRRDRIG